MRALISTFSLCLLFCPQVRAEEPISRIPLSSRPMVMPSVPDCTGLQGYVGVLPRVGMAFMHGLGLAGSNIRLSDCEYGWNADHEALFEMHPGHNMEARLGVKLH